MTNNPSILKTLSSSSQNFISIVGSTPTLVTKEGFVVLSNILTLNSMLVVPSLTYNLLSVSQIILDIALIVTFYQYFYVF